MPQVALHGITWRHRSAGCHQNRVSKQGPVKVFALQLRLLSFGVGMGNVRAGSGGEVQWSML